MRDGLCALALAPPGMSALGDSHIQMALGRMLLVSSLSLLPTPVPLCPVFPHSVPSAALLHNFQEEEAGGSHCTSDGPVMHRDQDTDQNSLPPSLPASPSQSPAASKGAQALLLKRPGGGELHTRLTTSTATASLPGGLHGRGPCGPG